MNEQKTYEVNGAVGNAAQDLITRKPKQRRLLSVRNAQNLGNMKSSSRTLFGGQRSRTSGIDSRKEEDSTRTLHHDSLYLQSRFHEKVVYDEKAESRRTPYKVLRQRNTMARLGSPKDGYATPRNESSDNSLSDFIVNDSASESELKRPPPSMRKNQPVQSVRTPHRNRRILISEDEDDLVPMIRRASPKPIADALQETSLNTITIPVPRPIEEPAAASKPRRSRQESPATKSLRYAAPTLEIHTPPTSPSKPKLQSPSKTRTYIPQSPHRQSIDAFWKQDVINDWIDVHSPQKTQKIKKFFELQDDDVDLSPSESPRRSTLKSPMKSPTKKDKAIVEQKKRFDSRKQALAIEFLAELDDVITGGKLAELSSSTGGVKIVWSKTLNSTAGRAKWQRESVRTTETTASSASSVTIYKHHASIELAEKVIDDEDRLLNVLAHEFCHLANFMVSKVKDQPHGKSFKAWAAKATAAFPHKNIIVTTKHSYTIDYKYIWGCTECGIEYKRHSKSIDPGRHNCGACKGKLVQIKPVPRGTSSSAKGHQNGSTGNPYQAFVKKWYATVKQENPNWKMKDIMSELAHRYKIEKSAMAPSQDKSTRPTTEVPVVDEVDAIIVISDDENGDDRKLDDLDVQLTALKLT